MSVSAPAGSASSASTSTTPSTTSTSADTSGSSAATPSSTLTGSQAISEAISEAEDSVTVQLLGALEGSGDDTATSGTLQQLMANTEADSLLLSSVSRQSAGIDVQA